MKSTHKASAKEKKAAEDRETMSAAELETEEEVEVEPGEGKISVEKAKLLPNEIDKLKQRYEDIKWPSDLPWKATQCLVSKEPLIVKNVEDDFERELAFYNQALEATKSALLIFKKSDIEWVRPLDYYAEMVKSDQHMEKVKSQLMLENKKIKESMLRKQNREKKKFSKKLEAVKKQEKQQMKNKKIKDITNLRKQRSRAGELGKEFDWDKAIEDMDDKPVAKKQKRKENWYGGRKRNSKKNTSESSANIPSDDNVIRYSQKRNFKKGNQRLGKSRRQAVKAKQKSKA